MGYVIGVDIGGTNTRALAVDAAGNAVGERIRLESHKDSVAAFVEQVCRVIERAIPQGQGKPLAVGVGLPGPVNAPSGVLFEAPHLPGFRDVPLGKLLGDKLKLPVFIENDANCAAFGEAAFGAARGKKDFLMLTFGTGIGGAIFSGGNIQHGKRGAAGEVGHMNLHPNGIACNCGRRGCFERYVSAVTVLNRAKETHPEIEQSHEIFEAADRGEAWAQALLEDVSSDLARGLGNLVNIFDPEAIVLGGGLFVQKFENFLELTREKLQREAFASMLRGFELLTSQVPGNAGLLGAAAMAYRRL